MQSNKLGEMLKKAREDKKLTKSELARIAGVSRTYIYLIEKGERNDKISTNMIIKLANALELSAQPFMEAMGAQYEEKNKLPQPISIPVYTDFPFHAGNPTQPIDHIYRTSVKYAPKNIEGYIVHGTCLLPVIQDGDIIIVDRDGQIDNGDIIACLMDEQLHIGRLRRIAGDLWLENNNTRYPFNECQVIAPVIEVIRRLK